MKHVPTSIRLGLATAIALTLATAGHAQTLLDHDFSAGVRNVQNLPSSAEWFKGGGSSASLDAAPGSLSFTTTASSHLVATNFVNSTAGYTLAVNETFTMKYTFSPGTVATGNSFNTDNRMGVFSYAQAPSARLAADNSSANGPGGGAGTPVLGYMFTFHVSDALAAQPFNIFRRTNTVNTSLLGSGGDYTNLGTTSIVAATGGLVSGGVYTLQLDILRVSATEALLTVAYLDSLGNVLTSAQATDAAASDAQLTFDAFVYRAANVANKGGVHTISGFEVAVVPEPSTYAALLGALALGLVAYRRRAAR
jgi:hypothetical protein